MRHYQPHRAQVLTMICTNFSTVRNFWKYVRWTWDVTMSQGLAKSPTRTGVALRVAQPCRVAGVRAQRHLAIFGLISTNTSIANTRPCRSVYFSMGGSQGSWNIRSLSYGGLTGGQTRRFIIVVSDNPNMGGLIMVTTDNYDKTIL